MYSFFSKAILGLYVSPNIYNLIGHDERVHIHKISDEYTKIHNSNYSVYFKNNKFALMTKHDQIQKIFMTVDDAVNILFTTTDL